MKKLFFTQLFLVVTLVWSFAQTTVTLPSSKDNTIFESATGVLSSGAGGEVITGRTNTNTNGLLRRAFMQFDASSIPTNATITSVSLKLQMTKTSSGTQTVGLHRVTSDWGEGASNGGTGNGSGNGATAMANDATWIHTFSPSSSWTTPGGDYVATASATLAVNAVGSYTWASSPGLVADVQGWVTNSSTNFGWAIIGNESVFKTTKHFVTKEGVSASSRPELSVTYTMPVTPNIVISEIHYNGPEIGADTTEYIELYNNGTSAVNLNGWSFSQGVTYTFPNISMNAGDYLVVAVDSLAMQNTYGFAAYEWTGGGLSNGGEDITIVDANGITIDSVDFEDNSNGWDSHPDGGGSSLVLCDVNANNNDPINWSRAYTNAGFTTAGLQIYGSPGAANNCTAPPVVTVPLANIGTVSTVDANGVTDSLGNDYEVRGVVYGVDMDGNNGLSFTLIDATGGINVHNSNDVDNYVVTQGDSIHLVGTIGQFNGLTQISPTSITLISQGNTINMPTVVTTLDETTESQLVRINGLTVVSGWNASGSFNATVTDGVNNYTLRVDSDINLSGNPAPTGTFDVIGLGGQFDNSNPYSGGYQIFPRDSFDIVTAALSTTVDFVNSTTTINENAGTITVDVLMVNTTMMTQTVDVVLDATNSTATNSSDFSYTSPSTLTFPANSATTLSVTISITDDMMMESNETIVLNLMNAAAGVTIGATATHTITINDNDATIPNIVINEIHYNQPGLDSLEYLELYNNSGSAANLQGWYFTQGVDYTFPAITLAAGDYLVLTNDSTAMQNAYGVTAYQWTSGSLSNGGEDIVLRSTSDIEVDSVIYDDGGAWSTLADGFGYGLELCDPNTDNLDPANWNIGATALNVTISGTPMFGTPGTANVCFVPAANPYPLRSVAEMTVTDANGVADSLNQGCELRGVVYGIDYDGDAGMSFTMIGAGHGINVFNFNDVGSFFVNEGDSIHVKGVIAQYNGLLEIIPDSIETVGTETINAPTIVTMFDESIESQFIKLETVTLVDATQWTGAGSGFNVDVRNTTDTFTVRIDNDCDLFLEPAPSGWFNVTGLGGQFDNSSPYTSGYQLFPRNQGDIELLINTNEPQNLSGQIKLFPNPTSGFLNIVSEVNLTAVRITNVLGQEVMNINQPNAQTALDVSRLTNGVYVITFMTEAGIWSEQFVKN